MYFSHSYLYIWRWKISLSYLFMGKYREWMVRPGGNWCNGINNVLKLCNWPYYVFLDTWNELYTARNTINISNIPNFEWFSEKMKTRFSSEMRVRLKFFDLPKILHASLYIRRGFLSSVGTRVPLWGYLMHNIVIQYDGMERSAV